MARRLNTRFLTILLLVVVGLAAAVLLAERFLIHEHPGRYIEFGKQAMKDRKWSEAVQDFAKAGKLDPRNPDTQMRLGAALANMAQTDPDAAKLEVGAYMQALEIDPKYLPALLALSDFFTKAASESPRADLYRNAIDYSQRAQVADPSNEDLQSRADRLIIQEWTSGLSANKSDVDGAIKRLKALWVKHPADAELPFSIANAQIEQGTNLAAQNSGRQQLKEVTDDYNSAVATFESVLTGPNGGSQGQNAAMHFNFAKVLENLSRLDQSSPDALKKYQDRASTEITRARDLVKPTDANYLEVNEFAADIAMRHGDRPGAIAIYKKMPDTPMTHLALADILSRSPDTQPEAVSLLKNTLASLPDDPSHVALGGIRFLLMLELTKVQVFQYDVMPASPERQKMHDELRASLDKLNQVAGVRIIFPLKEAEARFEIGSGLEEEMKAVQSLSKLIADNPPADKDYYSYVLRSLLAQGYEDTNQSANALAILKTIVQQFPHDVNARKHLIGLLLVEQPDAVKPQLAELERLSPNDPSINAYRIELLLSDPVKNKDQIEKFYRDLKEDSIPMMAAKARVALRIQNYDEATRLLTAVTTKDPSQVDEWVMLARLQFMRDKKEDALNTANKGLAANPKDPQLRLLIPRIKGESAKVVEDLQVELAKENPDKSQGELVQAEMAARRDDVDAEGAHLEAAAKASPESPRIHDMLFNYYLQQKKFDKAAQNIPALAKADADRAGGELYRLALAEAQNDNATAEAIARKLTQDKPEFARSWLAMGDVLQNEGQFAQAIPAYNTCLEKESDLVEGYIGLARCYYGMHQPADALHTIDNGLKRRPGDQKLSGMRLSHEMNYGTPEEAIKDIQQELTTHQDQPMLFAAMADAILRYCQELRDNKQPQDSIKQAEQGIIVLTDPLKKWPDEPKLYMAMSECQLAANHPPEAMSTLEAWAARDQWRTRPEPYLAMSELYERFQLPDKSEDELHTAMARSGYRPDLQIRMASLLTLHKKSDDALTLLRSVNSDKPEVKEKIIQILLVSGKFDEAQKELKADLATNPPDSQTLLSTWALATYEQGRFQESVDSATQALAIEPRDQTARFCRARALMRLQPPDPHAALQDLQAVRQISPNNIDVRLAMSDAYLMLNQPSDAATELQAGLRVLPNNKALRMKLVGLLTNGPHPRLPEALKLLQDVEAVSPFDKDPEVFQNESVIMAKMGNTDDALAKIQVARQLSPDDEAIARTEMQLLLGVRNFQGAMDRYATLNDKMKGSSWALWNLAAAEKGLDNPQSLPDFNRALLAAQREDQPVVLDSIARTMAQDFSYDDAINALIPISKDYVSAKITLARLYQLHGDDNSALATVDSVLANLDKVNQRDQINALSNAALMYQLAKPPLVDKAYDAYLKWLKIDPRNLEALNNMACLLADNYSPPRAQEGLEYANRAIVEMSRMGRSEPRLLDTQAWLMILNGSPEDGINILNKTMNSFDPFPDEYLHVGEGYLRKQLPDPAQAGTQAKLGLQLVTRRNAGDQDATIRAKLQDLINRSDELRHAKQQAQVP